MTIEGSQVDDIPQPVADGTAPDYETRKIEPARLDAVLKYAGRSILDVGCGSGAYVLRLKDRYDVRGVDQREFASWREAPELFSVSDAARLPVADGSVDTILSFETLEHLPDPGRALHEYFRVCRHNVILTVPNCDLTRGLEKRNLIYSHWIDRTHVNFFNMQSIVSLVEASGFRVGANFYINRLQLGPVVMEAMGFGGLTARIGARLFRAVQRRQYPITSLVVAEKP